MAAKSGSCLVVGAGEGNGGGRAHGFAVDVRAEAAMRRFVRRHIRFGISSFPARSEMFFGKDRLDQVEIVLAV
jgi:2-hydroxychromene-2-carboxylate isomerase